MRYPSFLNKGDLIGISAPSAGVGHKLESFDNSLAILRKEGYRIRETASVRLDSDRGGSAIERGEELNTLFKDPEVKMVMAAAGGDFLDEMLPYTDFGLMREHPKWLMGASDPTGLLFPYTTLCDVATLYGSNAGSYDLLWDAEIHFLKENLAILRGQLPVQEASKKHLGVPPFAAEKIVYDTPTVWESPLAEFSAKGRCIGGCIDVLKDLIGTPYDGANVFVDRYGPADGIIWYFDNFALSAEVLYRTLLQMRFSGWFRFAKAVIIGRTLFSKSESGMSYREAAERALGKWESREASGEAGERLSCGAIPWITEADIGHTLPHMTMINGAMLELHYHEGGGSLKFSLT